MIADTLQVTRGSSTSTTEDRTTSQAVFSTRPLLCAHCVYAVLENEKAKTRGQTGRSQTEPAPPTFMRALLRLLGRLGLRGSFASYAFSYFGSIGNRIIQRQHKAALRFSDYVRARLYHPRFTRSKPPRIFGDGEMAELTRRFGWSKTPVGPIETWPDTLLTTVNLLLATRHSMFLWWGRS
jgi:hypothetical protein